MTTLRVKGERKSLDEVAKFCRDNLWHDLRERSDALWFTVRQDTVPRLLHRMAPYLLGLFVLSNVARYEPELLDAAAREPSDLGFGIETFLNVAERFFPQLVLELLDDRPVFFS